MLSRIFCTPEDGNRSASSEGNSCNAVVLESNCRFREIKLVLTMDVHQFSTVWVQPGSYLAAFQMEPEMTPQAVPEND